MHASPLASLMHPRVHKAGFREVLLEGLSVLPHLPCPRNWPARLALRV